MQCSTVLVLHIKHALHLQWLDDVNNYGVVPSYVVHAQQCLLKYKPHGSGCSITETTNLQTAVNFSYTLDTLFNAISCHSKPRFI